MITLGGVELSDQLVWADRYSSSTVAQDYRRTLGGYQVITAMQLIAGRNITLEASETYGWLSKEQATSILEMSEDPGAVYTLVFGAESYQVVFRNDEQPSVELTPLIPRTEDFEEDWWIGTVKLRTV